VLVELVVLDIPGFVPCSGPRHQSANTHKRSGGIRWLFAGRLLWRGSCLSSRWLWRFSLCVYCVKVGCERKVLEWSQSYHLSNYSVLWTCHYWASRPMRSEDLVASWWRCGLRSSASERMSRCDIPHWPNSLTD